MFHLPTAIPALQIPPNPILLFLFSTALTF